MTTPTNPPVPETAPVSDDTLRWHLRAAAHELRTPLGGMAALIDLLAATDMPEGARAHIELLRGAVRQLGAIATDILDLGRLDAGETLGPATSFDPAALLASVTGLAAARVRGDLLAIRLETDLPRWLSGHPVMIRRAVENLIDNALKFTQAGSITLRARLEGQLLCIDVADTGPGMAPEDLPRLFSPYAQLDGGRRAGGTGLGLALVRTSLERMGGSIRVESELGQGSIFHLTIPIALAEAPPPVPQRAGAPNLPPLAILMVEDNPVNRIVAQAILTEFGHRLSFAGDARTALATLRKAPPDLVLMDLELPDLDGAVALQLIRELPGPAGRLPVIAVTARGEVGRAEAMQAGFDGYVVKPIDPAALWSAIGASIRAT